VVQSALLDHPPHGKSEVPSGVGLSDQVVGAVLGAALPVEGPAMIAAAATRPIVMNLMSIVTSPFRWRSFPVF
jgi:hypothetical protein